MNGRRLVATLAAVLALPGCTSAPGASPAGPSPKPSAAADTGTTPATTLLPPSSTTPGPTACATPGANVIPDGSWDGPLTLRVEGVAGVPATRSTGSGRLQVRVQDGQVVQGAWTLTWRASGRGTTDSGEATARLTADVAGTVHGPATQPVAHGAWALSGTVRVTSPVTATVPVTGSGEGSGAMSVRAGGCDAVTGTFTPALSGKDPLATIRATVRWIGHRQG